MSSSPWLWQAPSTLSDEKLWVELKKCIYSCLLKNVTSVDQLYVGKAKHDTYEKCKAILKKHWTEENVDPKRSIDCIEKHIFDDFPVPDSQIILGFFYVAYLMVGKNIPDLNKHQEADTPILVFSGPSAPPATKSTNGSSSRAVEELQLTVTKLIHKINELENHQAHTREQHRVIWEGPR